MFFFHKRNGLQFYNDILVYDKIHPISLVKLNIIPINGQKNLALYFISLLFQQIFQCCLISRLKKTRVVLPMNFHGDARYISKELILLVVLLYEIHIIVVGLFYSKITE